MRINIFFLLLLFSTIVRSQCTTTNATCASATPLTVNASCMSGSTCNGQVLPSGTSTSCTLFNIPNPGVWYTFVATDTEMNVSVANIAPLACFNRVLIFEGACGSLTEVDCQQVTGSTADFFISLTTLIPGNTYSIFIGHRLNGCAMDYNFCISVSTAGVSNDVPCDASPLTLNVPCTFSTFLNTGATDSGIPAPGCANYIDEDVWFSVTVPASGEVEIDFDSGVITDGGAAAYSGTCGALTLLDCDDNSSNNGSMPLLSLSSLTPGETVWIRVWENGGDVNGTFDICATDPSATPDNDDPCDAQTISVNSTCQFETYTNIGATNTIGPPAPGCANYQGADVWFSLTVPLTGNLEVDVSEIGMDDPDAAAYSGSCGSLSLIDCDDGPAPDFNPTLTLIGLTPGEVIWIRVWSYGNIQNGSFEICATELAACEPTNPICSDAISLTVGAACVNGSTCGGGSVESFSCDPSGLHNEAVWYSFVATQTEMLVSGSTSSSTCSFAISTFSGACGSLTEVGCNYDNSINAALPLSGLTVGQTYFVQVSYTSNVGSCDAFIDFCIAVEESPCLGNGSNNTCADADPFCTGSVYTYCNNTGIPSSGSMGCLSSTPNPMWLYFQIDNPGQIDMDIIQSDYYGANIDVNFSIWGPYSDISAACADAVSNPFTQDCSESTTLTENATIVAGQTGDIYVLLLTNESDIPGQVTITQVGGSGTTDCSIVLPCFISGVVTDASCFGAADAEIEASWTGSANYMIELLDNNGNQVEVLNDYTLTNYTFESLVAGSYTLTVTSSDGCTFSEAIIINQPSNVNPSLTGINPTCVSPSSGSVDIIVSGGDPAYNIVWTGPSNGDPSGNEIINSGGSYSVSSLVEGSYSFTITDESGCFSNEVITLSEIVCSAPTVSLPSGLPSTLDCASADSYAIPADATYTNSESGTCEISGTLSASVTNAFDACNGGTITIDYAGTDACGNSLTAQHVITVSPPAAPTVSLPVGLPSTLDCASADSYATPADATYTNSESGTCEISGTLSASVTNAFDACNGGTITIDYAGTDACGNSLTAQHVITVSPPAAPTVSLPVGLPSTLDCASADSYATPADATYTNSESGTCEISGTLSASVTNAFDACNGGTITIDYAGTDACGNSLTAQHVITVSPPAAPTVSLPVGLPSTLDCASADSYATPADATYTNSESGTCEISGTLSASVTNAFDACNGGTITIDYAGTDACGNSLTAQHVITVSPPAAPTVSLPVGLPSTLDCASADSYATPADATYTNSESGTCEISGTLSASVTNAFDACNGGTITIDYAGTDACGNSLTAQHVITVSPPAAPTVSLPVGLPSTLDCASADSYATPADATYTNSESGTCEISGTLSASVTNAFDACNGGTITIDYAGTDACGNSLTAQHVITVSPPAAPTVSLPVGLPSTLDCASADSYATPADATYTNSESGTCEISGTLSASVTNAFDACNGGTITIDYAGTDACGNSLTAQHVITVSPPAAPTVSLPVGLPSTLDCASADSYATPADATYTNSESGTCEISGTLSASVTNAFDACNGGTITIDYAGTDACGNSLTAQHVITVSPPAAPTVSLPVGLPSTLDCASADSYATPADATYTNSESGTCEISGTLSASVTNAFDACNGGTITIDYAGTDACGNSLTAQHVITVSPPAAPTVSLPVGLPSTLDCASADSYATPADATYTNSESGTCEISGTLSASVTNAFDACNGGTITIDYAGTDACGNSLTAQHVITVSPPAAPTVSLPVGLPSTLDCASADSYATPADATYTNSESGTCEISGTLSASVTNAFDACNGGTITIDYAGTDACGNSLTAQHVITVSPPAAPTVSLPVGLPSTLDCASADSYATPADATYTNSESGTCEISGTLSASVTNAFDACNGGTITIDYAGTDACGNSLTAQHVITVSPPAAPTVSLPVGLPSTLDCASADSYATPADATYTNSESGTCEISGTLSASVTNAFDACNGGTITIDYAGTDACGNSLTAQHVITVSPPAAPTVSLPVGLPSTLDCASADSYATPADATYTNSESGTCEISGTLSASVTNAFDACNGGTITIDYAGTDACGNSLTAQHVITVSPPAAPTVSLPVGLPSTLDCASADSYATPADATYTNSESGTCEISGTLSASVTNAFDACNGGTITIDYAGTDACGNSLTAQHVITVSPPAAPTVSLPVGLPGTINYIIALTYSTNAEATYTNSESGTCEISGVLAPIISTNFDCNGGTITIDYAGTDACGSSISAQHLISIDDAIVNTSTTDITICDTDLPYSWNGLTFTGTDSQVATLTSLVTGCDSLATLNLTVDPTLTSTTDITICDSQLPYVWNGLTFNGIESQTATLTSLVTGCDSLATLNLNVNSTLTSTTDTTVCDTELPFAWNGLTFTAAGTQTSSLVSAVSGCDSLATLNVTVNPTLTSTTDTTVCDTELPFAWNGLTFTVGGTQTTTLGSLVTGCDSIVTLNVTVNPTLTSTTDITICDTDLPYSWNGLTFTGTDSQVATLTSLVTGCDSLATLNLTVDPTLTSTTDITICDTDLPYSWNGLTFTGTDSQVATLTSLVTGCDSLATLNLTVDPTLTSTTDITICDSQLPYVWNGLTFNGIESQTATLTSLVTGCDSLATLNLNVNSTLTSTTDTTVCDTELPFAWNGLTFTAAGTQTSSLVSAVSGCDSLATLNVTVNPTLTSTTDTTVCDTELPFAWNGLTFTVGGTQTTTLGSLVTGCDSIVTLNVTVNPTLTSTTDITICDTDLPYSWNGLTFTGTDSQVATLTSLVTGCDSLATLNLTVDPTLTSTTDITICDTDLPYSWNGLTFTGTDSQVATLTSLVTGCDSLATLNLTVDPTLTSTTDITICDSQLPYVWNGLTFNGIESQTATLTSLVTGCDSLATLNLNVNSTLTSTTDTTVCDTELPFAWNGLTFTAAGTQTSSLVSAVSGCDSLATLNVTVNPTLTSTTDTTVCDTELPFAWNGLTFTVGGTQTTTLGSLVTGCDSIVTLNVTVNPTLTSTTDITICDTDLPYSWNGLTFTGTDSQVATLTSLVTGCDSLATLNLTVDPTLTSTTDITICDTDLPYSWNGLTFTGTDSQVATLTSLVTGCDSLATLNLTVDPTLTSTTDITICDSQLPYVWNGLTFNGIESQTATLTSLVTGCDSLATLNLNVNSTLTSTTDTTVCDTELPFAWNGLTFTAAGTQTSSLVSAVSGCDSLATLNVTVNPTLTSTTDTTVCDTELPFAWNGLTFTVGGTQTTTLGSLVTGCDSIVTLNVTVNPTLTSTTDITICDTDLPYSWNGLTFTGTDSQVATLTSLVTGCDSLATLNLTVDPTLTSTTDITICDTDLPYSWNGLTFTGTDSQVATLTSLVTGCDSLATLNLTVDPTLTSTTDITICDSQLPYVWNGLTFNGIESQTATLTSLVTGCDSLATLNLNVNSTLTSTTDTTVCDTELPFAWNGLTFTAAGTQTSSLVSAVSGCDSLATLNVTVNPTLTSTTDTTVCDTELPFAWNGLTFTVGGTQTTTLGSLVTGCDSIVTLNVTVNPTLTSTTDITICDTDLPYSWNGLTFTGTDSQVATLTSLVTGCDSLATLNLTVDPTLTSTTDITICDTDLPYSWNGLTFTGTDSQVATLTSLVTGCDSLATLNLTVDPTLTSTTDITICDSQLPYVWNGLTFNGIESQTATLTSLVTGCDSLATLNLNVNSTLTSTTDTTVCDTELPFAWNGLTFTAAGTQTSSLVSAVSGCDSLATLNVTVNPTLTSTTDTTVCDTELPFAWNGLTFTVGGTQTTTLGSLVTGCDSIVTLNVTVNPTLTSTTDITICDTDLPYSWNGLTFTGTDSQVATLTSLVTGCDSLATLNLTVDPTLTSTTDITICDTDLPYSWNGLTFTGTDSQVATLTSLVTGCDSLATLNLTVDPTLTSTTDITICDSQLPYVWNGLTFNGIESQTATLTSLVTGCDSLATLNLNVNSTLTSTTDTTVCDTELPFAWNGLTFTAAGTQTSSLVSAVSGCDSLATLNVTVNPTLTSTTDTTVCDTELPFAWNGLTFTVGGTQTTTLGSLVTGCDSIVTLNVTVNPTLTSTTDITICDTDLPYSWNGLTFTGTDSQVATLTSLVTGCDSLATLNLTVDPTLTSTTDITICDTDLPYSWNGLTFTGTDSQVATLTSLVTGCDSLATLNLTVDPTLTSTTDITICDSQLPYVWNGLTFNGIESQTATLTSLVTGCDSLATLNLNVNSTLTSTTDTTVCDTELPFAWNGLTFTAAGTQTSSLVSAVSGCDSLATLNVTVNPTLTSTTDTTVCDTELPFAWNGLTFTVGGTQTTTLGSLVTGCDSIVTLNVTVNPTLTSTTDITICDTDLPYSWNGLTFTGTDSQVATLTSLVTGCDSLATLNLTVDPTLTSTTDITICDTDLPYSWNGLTFTGTDSQVATLTSLVTGCDSLATLNLTVDPTLTSTTDITICDSQLPYVWNGLTFNGIESQTATLTSLVTGCDSLATLNLNVNSTLTSTTDTTVCDTELPFAWNGLTFTAAGTQTSSLVSAVSGCDSLATLNVTVNPTLTSTTDTTVCDTELPFAWNGLTFTVGGTQTTTLGSLVTGCDSIVTLNVTVNPTLTSTTDITICDTDLPYSWNGLTFTGTDSQVATLTSLVTGCDSLATLNLTVDPTLTSTTDITICDTDLPYSWNGLTFTGTDSQVATLTSLVTGCDSLATLNLTVDPTLTSTTDITICDSQLPYVWNGLTFNGIESQTATLTSLVTGCDSLATLNLNVNSTLTSTTDTTVCDTELPFAWNGLTFTAAGTQTSSLVSAVSGCDSLATLNVTVNPTLTSTTDTTVCDTELPFAWNGLTFTVGGTQTTTLGSLVTGCDSIVTLNVTVNPTPDLFYVLSDSEICSGDITDLTLNSSYAETIYSWDFSEVLISGATPGNGNQINQQINTTSQNQGTVTYIITPILNFCIGTPVVVPIDVNPIPTVTVTPSTQTIYAGQTATLNASGSPSGGTYVWSPEGQTTASITVSPITTTTYDVNYSLSGCSNDSSGVVIVDVAPTVSVNSGVICSGDSILLLANPSIPGGTYLWSNNEVTSSIWVSPTSNMVYSVEYTVNGFTTTPAISTVTVNQTPIVTVEDQVICDGQSATISATTSLAGGTYSWLPGGENQQQISVSPNATTQYQVEYILNGCLAIDSAVITVNPIPNIIIDDTIICFGETVELNAVSNLLGGTYLWGDNSTESFINVTPNTTTSYSVLYTLNGCQNSASGTVNVNEIPIVQVTDDVICEGETGLLTATPNSLGGTYFWNGVVGSDTFSDNPIQTTGYTLVYILNSCESLPTVGSIIVNEVPQITLEDTTICLGDDLILSSEASIPGGNYLWSPNNETTSAIQVSPILATAYTVDYILNGCEASASAQVSVQVPSQIAIEVSDTLGCAPFEVTFNNPFANGNSQCIWDFGNGLEVGGCNPTYTFNEEGCYDVTLTSSEGVCASQVTETNIVCVEGPPVASFYANPPIITDPTQWIQFSNNSFGAVDYEWNFGDGQNSNLEQPQHLYTDINDGFIITLIASSELGCIDTAQVSIIYQEEPIVYIPNTFTPDGDQYNHVFVPVFTSGYDPFNYEMLIFNRWGEIVFESRDVNVGWDGTYGLNGTDAQDGAYTYKIIYKVLKTDERRLLVGHVNLIR